MPRLMRAFKRLKERCGTAATEFAILLPVVAMLTYGIYAIADAVRIEMKVSNAAASMADLVAQQVNGVTSGTSGVLGNFCQAGVLMMTPFLVGNGGGTFSAAMASVTNYSSGGVTVDWESDKSCPTTATAMGANAKTLATTPTDLLSNAGSPGDSVIVVQVTYSYEYLSSIQYLFPGAVTITRTAFARPRGNSVISCTAPCL